MTNEYLISICNDRKPYTETIHHPGSKLKIGVFEADPHRFEPRKGEVYYFVSEKAGSKYLGFETVGYSRGHKRLTILTMISWYCVYFGLIEPQIHASLPGIM